MTRLVYLTDDDIEMISNCLDKCPEHYSNNLKIKNKLIKSQSRIKNSSAKNKGRDFQYFCCGWVSRLLDIPFNQQDDNSEIQSRPASQQGSDVILRGNARKRFPFDIEAKNTKELAIHDAIEQAGRNASDGRLGVVFYKQTNRKPFVAFSLDVFEAICKRYVIGV